MYIVVSIPEFGIRQNKNIKTLYQTKLAACEETPIAYPIGQQQDDTNNTYENDIYNLTIDYNNDSFLDLYIIAIRIVYMYKLYV